MSTTDATPIRRQYLELKRRYADCILFFRLGDFYETFDSDAELVARELDVVLTSRPVGKDTRVPMAGVPHHAAESYIARLIERGYRVAVADQIGSEAINGLVPREVRRVITPGTVIEPAMLQAEAPNYLAAVIVEGDPPVQDAAQSDSEPPLDFSHASAAGLAYCDITTGEFAATQLDSPIELERELARLQPREILIPEHRNNAAPSRQFSATQTARTHTTPFAAYRFEHGNARQTLLDHFKVHTLAGFGIEDQPMALRAAGAIVAYLRETQPAALAQLTELRTYSTAGFMGLDAVTRRNLELTEGLRSRSKHGSLLGVLDRTLTPMGARLLRAWVSQPLLDRAGIEARLQRIDRLYADALLRTQLREALKHMPDLERLTGRVVSGIATPKDLLTVKVGVQQALKVGALVGGPLGGPLGGLMGETELPNAALSQVIELIETAIRDEPDDDGFIKPGYCAELDAVHASAREAKTWIAGLERLERERTGIKSLKVGFNKVFGYYIEVTHANTSAIPAEYIRKQTLTNAERYITPELKEREALVLNAGERIAEIEARLLREINSAIADRYAAPLMAAARAVARLDVAASLAEVAARHNYCRPTFNEEGRIHITAGRHPVIEQLLQETPYTPNDTHIDADARILIITGPNMSGKSSYMRQVALIGLLAQIGSYVPAQAADLCLIDRIFTRIGAQDELTAGQSTFMVEMVETANILHHCTPRSLVILDEIGRGTSTYDGLAIAWSVIEFLHNHPERRAMTLFATHYHELIQLADKLPHVRNYNVAVSEADGRIVFLHKVIPGGADRSYGIHVAQLAGLPPAVVHRAQDILRRLQDGTLQARSDEFKPVEQLPMFVTDPPALTRLKQIDPDGMSPLEALTALYELKKLLQSSKSR
ncbi:MAG: DNA mismatch repair protein MutS [Anaerolineae bacterium]|nr:DNA mismatch repair protein MutS [Thermoflexales bacterium]MDW8407006.1 DNA mismatch repair protein MutS [Anaerolineae bacterium]